MTHAPLTRRVRGIGRRFRQIRMLARALKFPHQPINVHLIPIRRCNLSCKMDSCIGARSSGGIPDCRTVGCVHRVAQLDELREHPLETLVQWFSSAPGMPHRLPASVRLLKWMFITGPQRRFFRNTAVRIFGAR